LAVGRYFRHWLPTSVLLRRLALEFPARHSYPLHLSPPARIRKSVYPIEKIVRAIARRSGLRQSGVTAYRMVDGSGDDLPNWAIDDFNGNWLIGLKPGREMPNLDTALGYRSLYGKILTSEAKKSPIFMAGEPVTRPFLV